MAAFIGTIKAARQGRGRPSGLAFVFDILMEEGVKTPSGLVTRVLPSFDKMNLNDRNGVDAPNPGAYRSACEVASLFARATGETVPQDVLDVLHSAPDDPDDPESVEAHRAEVAIAFVPVVRRVRDALGKLVGLPVSGEWEYVDSTAKPGTQVLSIQKLYWGLGEAEFDKELESMLA